MILARRMKLVLLTTNQTLIFFVSVLEVSVSPLEEIQKQLWERNILGQMKRVDKHQMRQGYERSQMRHPLQKNLKREREREYINFFSDCQSVLRLRFYFFLISRLP